MAVRTRAQLNSDAGTKINDNTAGEVSPQDTREMIVDLADSALLAEDGLASVTDLASTSNGEGASTIGVEDSGGNFTGTDVEAVLAELAGGGGGGLANIVEDTTPQLGGTLDPNSQRVSGDWLPQTDSLYDVGSATYAWAEGHFDQLFVGGNEITALADPGVDSLLIWDDSAGTTVAGVVGNGLSITGTTVNADLDSSDIGVSIQAYDVDTLKADTADILTAGFGHTDYNAGTKSSGTFTPDEADGNVQYAVNGGAHTLAPPTNSGTILIQYTNNGSAGTITTSGFTLVDGDSLTTTDGDDFFLSIMKANGFSSLTVKALQ